MITIFVSRKVFNTLDEKLQQTYIEEKINDLYFDILNEEEINYVIKGILYIIRTNEKFHKKYGVLQQNGLKQVDDTCLIPSETEPTGYYYTQGTIVICPFDWSWDENGNFDYSFSLAKIF